MLREIDFLLKICVGILACFTCGVKLLAHYLAGIRIAIIKTNKHALFWIRAWFVYGPLENWYAAEWLRNTGLNYATQAGSPSLLIYCILLWTLPKQATLNAADPRANTVGYQPITNLKPRILANTTVTNKKVKICTGRLFSAQIYVIYAEWFQQ